VYLTGIDLEETARGDFGRDRRLPGGSGSRTFTKGKKENPGRRIKKGKVR